MGKQDFDLVMSEIDTIREAVNKFPECAQGAACTALVSALLHEDKDLSDGNENGHQSKSETNGVGPESKTDLVSRDHVAEIKRDVAEFNLADVRDIDYAAYVTQYYTEVAPEHIRVDFIAKAQLEEAFAIGGRKPPKNFNNTLNNAKKAKEPLLKSGPKQGTFVLTPIGRYHVENVLLKRDVQ